MGIAGKEFGPLPDDPALFEPQGLIEHPKAIDISKRRAFGSVPGLIGKNIDIPPYEKLDEQAKIRVEPNIIERGLLGHEGRNAVDGIVLSAEEHKTVVRWPRGFQSAIQSTNVAANRGLVNDVRAKEKEIKSAIHAFSQKGERQQTYLKTLNQEQATLEELLEWQRTPGFARTTQIDIVSLANQAWNLTFRGMLQTLKDQHELTAEQHIDMVHAMAYRLFRGPQRERIGYWGDMLQVAHRYNRAKTILFNDRQRRVARHGGQLALQLNELYDTHGIS